MAVAVEWRSEACTVPPSPASSRAVTSKPTPICPQRRRGNTCFRKNHVFANRPPRIAQLLDDFFGGVWEQGCGGGSFRVWHRPRGLHLPAAAGILSAPCQRRRLHSTAASCGNGKSPVSEKTAFSPIARRASAGVGSRPAAASCS